MVQTRSKTKKHEENPDDENTHVKMNLNVEVVQKYDSNLPRKRIQLEVDQFLKTKGYVSNHTKMTQFGKENAVICQHVESVILNHDEEGENGASMVYLPYAKINYKVYKLNRNEDEEEDICLDEEEEVSAAQHWTLPNQEFQGVWENLVYDTSIKTDLLRFVSTSLLLSEQGVDQNIVCCNRVVLLHGPPGTGKTSLCKALAQQLSIELSTKYTTTRLVEINSHSLFSMWFSESSKLVQKMFTEIKKLMEDTKSLVCVLIDEVESLTAARKNSMSGSEPSDAIRVVNALLTQLDSIKNSPNVLILTTSNITGAIDLAFVDRADVKQYVGTPSQGAIYQILHSCIVELVRTSLVEVQGGQVVSLRELQLAEWESGHETNHSLQVWEIAGLCLGMSGRTIRKIAFLALALFSGVAKTRPVSMEDFLNSLEDAAHKQIKDREYLGKE